MTQKELKKLLDEAYLNYNTTSFVPLDPISIPHLFTKKEDIEIAGFIAATLAWGQRATIIKNTTNLMNWMDNEPHQFILNHSTKDLKPFSKFVHRTFNNEDCVFFLKSLQNIYKNHNGLEAAFSVQEDTVDCLPHIEKFRSIFFSIDHPSRTGKHIAQPAKGSTAKRLCMYLRWMVRDDKRGVDFGIWKGISTQQLCIPLDVHTGRVARKLGLLSRLQDDWKAVAELSANLKKFDKQDPIKYDLALFGLGVYGVL